MGNVGDNITVPLDDWKDGDALSARHWNQPVKVLRDLVKGVTPPGQVVLSGSAAVAAAGAGLTRVKVVEQKLDYLICKDMEDSEVLVAKPFDLRPTLNVQLPGPGEGGTGVINYTYTAPWRRFGLLDINDFSVNQQEEIVPPYYVDGFLLVAILSPSIVGQTKNAAGEDLEIGMMDLSARAWAATQTVMTPRI